MRLKVLSSWQWTTLLTLTVGYMGYYFCRSNLSVAGPLLIEEYASIGFTKESFGLIATIGVGFYTFGKLFNGVLCDFIGGRRMFLFGMAASIMFTLFFSLSSGILLFGIFWAGNRLVQSMGWGALVKTTSRWFPAEITGTVLGVISLSYLFGDVIARLFLGKLITNGATWQQVFWAAAAVLGVIMLATALLLKEKPGDVGQEEPVANPNNLYGEKGNDAKAHNLVELLKPFLLNFSFWLICMMSFGLTLIRETFNFWTPIYLTEVAKLSTADAAMSSGLFPFFGGVSVLLVGFLSDNLTKGKRGMVMVGFLVPAALCLAFLAILDENTPPYIHLTLISAVGLMMLGPYSVLAGAMSVDIGGKHGSASAAGLIDTAGYLGGMVSGYGIGKIAASWGWSGAFAFLSTILFITIALAILYSHLHEKNVNTHESKVF